MDADTPEALLAGRYRLERRLGRGGMGEVWAAHDIILDRAVAVKLLRDDRATQDPTLKARFVSEARASARFHHPNVVDVFDAGADEDALYLVMERLPGVSLGHKLLKQTLSAEEARLMAGDVLAGLGAAHAANLVHRDIKPPNILRTEEGRWKLVDFGIAKSLDDTGNLTATGITIGSPSYLAPEQIQGDAATPVCDIWGMGVVLYESLAGKKPFRGDTPYALAEAVCTTEPEPLGSIRPDLDAGLVAVVHRALSKPPGQRFQTAADMADALQGKKAAAAPAPEPTAAMAAPEPTRVAAAPLAAPSPPPIAPVPTGKRRSFVPWVIGALLLVGVLAAAAMAAGGGDGGQEDDPTTTESTDQPPTSAGDDGTGTSTTPAPETKGPGEGDGNDDDGNDGEGNDGNEGGGNEGGGDSGRGQGDERPGSPTTQALPRRPNTTATTAPTGTTPPPGDEPTTTTPPDSGEGDDGEGDDGG